MDDPMAHLRGERLTGDLAALAAIGVDPAGGITRVAFSPDFMRAADWLMVRMREAGMTARMDAAGNVIGRIGSPGAPAIVCGSHIDTVPGGGAYDGALGVLAGLECARVLGKRVEASRFALEVIAFADEEGAYLSLFGSRAMTGALDLSALGSDHRAAIERAMAGAGLDPSRLSDARRPASDFAAYVELHIEQGPVLEAAGRDAGIVEAIVGMDLARYRFEGEARHSGSTPMSARRDAARGGCAAISAAYAAFDASPLADTGRMTFGQIAIAPGASNVVPAQARISSEVRAQTREDLARLREIVEAQFHHAADRFGLTLHIDSRDLDLPVPLSSQIGAMSLRAAEHAGIATARLPSGACHDAQIFARIIPAGMIFCSSDGGISHHKSEYSSPEAIVAGARILVGTIEQALEALP